MKLEIVKSLSFIKISNFQTVSGKTVSLELSYQTFGRQLGEAPVVMVNHALTGNSDVAGDSGWWQDLIGKSKCVDTDYFTVLAFNIPGNGFDGKPINLIDDYKSFVARDVAGIFAQGIDHLGIREIFAAIGGSVGGGLVWELAALRPKLVKKIVPIACDWKSTDWLIGNCFIQDNILNNSVNGLADARMHAMTLYRTPESFKSKFNRSIRQQGLFNVESWLNHHGKVINERFQLVAYKMMNQILKTIDISNGNNNFIEVASRIESEIHIISIDSDLFFKARENRSAFTELIKFRSDVSFNEIKSIHGHDAFLIEYSQLSNILFPIFNDRNENKEVKKLKAS